MNRILITLLLLPLWAFADEQCKDDELLLNVPSPVWQDQVLYMLFIDRFSDGNPGNNDHGYGEYNPASGAHFSGGDLQGIIDQLDYLKSLGVTAIWISPPVYNQWWSTPYLATGWHGYWAVNFKEVDPHFGTLADYKRLSHELHCRGMYLIQDIVANHTANFYTYDGGYDPNDTAKNFRLLEPDSHQPIPTQPPFDLIDRHNPEHAAANIYHWTPTLQDFTDRFQETNYMFGQLADINTENPVVIDALKDTYKYWISEVGVDAFRIDTVMLVDHEFWYRFLHDEDGIYSHASTLGKEHFLTFGESVSRSAPFQAEGEDKLKGYIGTAERPYVNSMLGYPLYFEINRVVGRGQPTTQLGHRLELMMETFDDPFSIPNFIDNHDTPRFLATGNYAAYQQALALLFTIPGIPILYQGTEQASLETRAAMFKGGFNNPTGSFHNNSKPYQLVKQLSSIRRSYPLLSRGDLSILATESAGPGLFAYQRTWQGNSITVLINTANHSVLAHRMDIGAASDQSLAAIYTSGGLETLQADDAELVTVTLPPRSVFVSAPYQTSKRKISETETRAVTITAPATGNTFSQSFMMSGHAEDPGELQLIVNGNLDKQISFTTDKDGQWQVEVPLLNYGTSNNYAEVFAPSTDAMSKRLYFTAAVTEPSLVHKKADPAKDDMGPTGTYLRPTQPQSRDQKDLLGATVKSGGSNLELTLHMSEISTNWVPANGFDNVALSLFFDTANGGKTTLPRLNAEMPESYKWDLAHIATGWLSYMYSDAGATETEQGEKLGVAPLITTDREAGTITFFYEGERMGVDNWAGSTIYVSTWEAGPEGEYTEIYEEPSDWAFGGAPNNAPKVFDDLLIRVPQK